MAVQALILKKKKGPFIVERALLFGKLNAGLT